MDKQHDTKDIPCVREMEKGEVVVRLLRYTKHCCHTGFVVETYHKGPKGILQTGCFGWEDILPVVQLLLEAGWVGWERTLAESD